MRPGVWATAAAALTACTGAVISPRFAPAEERPQIVRGHLGFGGTYRPDAWNPLRLELLGGDRPFTGLLQYHCTQDSEHLLASAVPVSLAPAQRRFVTVYVRPASSLSGPTSGVDLVDPAGRRVHGREIDSTGMGRVTGDSLTPGEIMVLVVGSPIPPDAAIPGTIELDLRDKAAPTPTPLPQWMSPVQAPRRINVQTARCDPAELPTDALGYDAIDVVVWNHSAVGAISDDQVDALHAWLLGGGKLIYCPQFPSPTRKEPFSRLLVYPHVLKEQDAEDEDHGRHGRGTLPAGRELVFDYDVPDRASRSDAYAAGLKGLGVVVQLRFGAFDRRRSQDLSRTWEELLKAWFDQQPRTSDFQGGYYFHGQERNLPAADAMRMVVGKIGRFAGRARPNLGLTLLLCLLLTAVAGPGEYYVLRMIQKPNWTWWVMPVTLGFFCLLALVVAGWLHSGDLQFTGLTLIDHAAGSPTAYRQSYFGLYSPSNQSYRLTIHGREPSLSGLSLEGLGWYGGQGNLKSVLQVRSSPPDATGLFTVPVATTRFYESQDILSAEAIPVAVELRSGRAGRITNKGADPITGAWLLSGDTAEPILRSPLPPGESQEFGRSPVANQGPLSPANVNVLTYASPHRNAVLRPKVETSFWKVLGTEARRRVTLVVATEPAAGIADLAPRPAVGRQICVYRILLEQP